MIRKIDHHVVLDTLLLRVLDITLPAGETSLEHAHDHDFATVALGNASIRSKRPGEEFGAPRPRPVGSTEIVEYTGARGVHTSDNIDKTPYHLIAVENYRSGGWTTVPPFSAPATTLIRQTRAFTLYDVKLSAAAPTTNHAHAVPTVAVLVSGAVTNQGTNGEEAYPVQGAGKWVLIPAAQSHTLSVAGTGDAHIVEIEVR